MAEFPSLPLWTDAWLADTKHLTRLERGTYMDLLLLIWRSPDCRAPNDDAWLGKRMAMSPDEVATELRPIIAEFCASTGNWISQKRLRKEWDFCQEKSGKNRRAAHVRWDREKSTVPDKPLQSNEKASCERYTSVSTSCNAPTPTPTPTPKERKKDAANAAMEPTEQGSSHVAMPTEETELYRRGKAILGTTSGGLISKLLKTKNRQVALARAAIEMASTKQDPKEYIGRVISGRSPPSTTDGPQWYDKGGPYL